MNDISEPATEVAARPSQQALPWLLLILAIAAMSLWLWKPWARPVAHADVAVDLSPEALDSRLLKTEQGLNRLSREKDSLQQRLTDTGARTGLLRDEMLGLGQRAALLEDSVRELASAKRGGEQALRLDEAELLLTIAAERWQLAGDLNGAIRATALAEGVLSALKDPELLNLRQTLSQELAALRALPEDPRARAAGELDALQAALSQLATPPVSAAPQGRPRNALQRLLDALVQVRPSGAQDLLSPDDRATGEAALALELALARSAVEHRDSAALRAGVQRIDGWLGRLYADNRLLRERRERLAKLASLPLTIDLPVAGSTLAQLRELQRHAPSAP